MNLRKCLLLIFSFSFLPAQQEVPLGLNLPTTSYLKEGWGLVFTHRFAESVVGNSQNLLVLMVMLPQDLVFGALYLVFPN